MEHILAPTPLAGPPPLVGHGPWDSSLLSADGRPNSFAGASNWDARFPSYQQFSFKNPTCDASQHTASRTVRTVGAVPAPVAFRAVLLHPAPGNPRQVLAGDNPRPTTASSPLGSSDALTLQPPAP